MITADSFLKAQTISPIGNRMIDELLNGGFHSNLIYLFIGPGKFTNQILHQSAFSMFAATYQHHPEEKILYIDGENRFDPYFFSNRAVAAAINPSDILNGILLSRIFTWNQMVEIAHEKIVAQDLSHVNTIIISGLTKMFEGVCLNKDNSLSTRAFQDLNKICQGLKVAQKHNPNLRIILSAPYHSHSEFRPSGGNLLTHFANVITGIYLTERTLEFVLQQHPYLPERRIRAALKPIIPQSLKIRTLDLFMK